METAGPRYLIHAGPHLMAKEFRYFQILIVKTVIHHRISQEHFFKKITFFIQMALDRVHNLYKYFSS